MKSLQVTVDDLHRYVLVCIQNGREAERHLCYGLDPLAEAIGAFMGIDHVDSWGQAVALSKAAYAAKKG